MDAMPRVSIIILNWNGWKDTIECLESVYQSTYPNYDVIVVDNDSKDESIDKIKEYAGGKLAVTSKYIIYNGANKPLHYIEYSREEAETGGGREVEIADLPSWKKFVLIKNDKNYGFAEGNNIAIRYSINNLNTQYIFLLNNDTIIEKTCLGQIIEIAERNENAGILGPMNYYYNYRGRSDIIHFAGGKINWLLGTSTHIGKNERDIGQFAEIAEVEYITGAALCAKAQMIKEIGLLNAQFFE